jgi:hypothetical protein
MRASKAVVNTRKSKALALGSWGMSTRIMDVNYVFDMKILGLMFTGSVTQSGMATWSGVTGRVRAVAREAYPRELCLSQRIWFVHTYNILSVIWHTA